MTESRVPRLPAGEAAAAARAAGVPEFMAELSIFRVLLRHPRVARAVHDLLMSMLLHATLDPRLRELVIMRIGWLTASDYEWAQHWRIALGVGVSADDLLAVRDWYTHDAFDSRDRAVLAATDEVVHDGAITTKTWATCERELGSDPAVLIELVTAIGTWRMIASLVNSFEVPLEDGAPSWPPDGQPPSR